MEESQQLSDMWLENLKELISCQRDKINQLRIGFEQMKSENTSLKLKLNDREQKIYQLEKKLRSLNVANKLVKCVGAVLAFHRVAILPGNLEKHEITLNLTF